jgi:cytochrome c biogenesis protein CcdA
MLRLIGLVVSIGLADSLNPTTLAPALYLASGEHARPRLIQFTLGVLVVYFVGGALIALGPGQLLLSLVPKPDAEDRHVLEVVVGVAMVVAAALLWQRRERLAQRRMPTAKAQGKSSAILGATITAVELPTAFPYFAAIAAIVGLDAATGVQLGLVCLFNVIFLAPLLAIATIVRFSPRVRDSVIGPASIWINRHWPLVFAVVMAIIGAVLLATGSAGLARA